MNFNNRRGMKILLIQFDEQHEFYVHNLSVNW